MSYIGSKTVLLVDDDNLLRWIFRETLSDAGFKVIEAGSGNEAIRLCRTGAFSAIITDVRMPDGDGIELLRNVREAGHSIPVFMVTGYAETSEEELLASGATALVRKPFDVDTFLGALKSSVGAT